MTETSMGRIRACWRWDRGLEFMGPVVANDRLAFTNADSALAVRLVRVLWQVLQSDSVCLRESRYMHET